MTADQKRAKPRLIFILPVLLGFATGAWMAMNDYSILQDSWATDWLVKEIERVVPSYWIEPDGVAYFDQISAAHQEAMDYWTPYPAVTGTSLVSITAGDNPRQATSQDHYPLTFPNSTATVTVALPSFLKSGQAMTRLVVTAISCLLIAGLAIRILPRPYSRRQAMAIAEGLPMSALGDSRIASIFENEAHIALLVKLLNTEENDYDIAEIACKNDDAARLAAHCFKVGWTAEDVYTILREGKIASSFPDATGSDYKWWKLLTKIHNRPPLDALQDSQKPKLMNLDSETCTVEIRGLSGHIPPRSFALLFHVAQRKNKGDEALHRPSKVGDPKLTEALSKIYEDLPRSRDEAIFSSDVTGSDLGQMIAHLNRSIKKIIGDDNQAEFYEVHSEGKKKGNISYDLQCSAEINSKL